MFYGQIEQQGYLDDFDICFCAVGDCIHDNYPIQITDFEKGLDKIRELRSMMPELDIEIDGGVKLDNILSAKEAGANIFVVGSAIFKTDSPEMTCRKFVETVF